MNAVVAPSPPVLEEVGEIDRQRYIGGSDIAGILEVSPWQSPVTVYQRKTEAEKPREESPGKKKIYQRGKVWESVVGEMLVAELESRGHKVKVLSTNHRYRDPVVPYFAAEIDYEIQLDDIPGIVNVELKTVHPFAAKHWGETDTDECPVHYAAQAMWGLGITGRQCCIVAPLFGADEIRVYPIVRDEATIVAMRARASDFWNLHVIPRIPPAPKTKVDADKLYRFEQPKKEVDADAAAIEHALRFRSLDTQITALEAQRDEMEFYLKRFMADAEILKINGKKAFSWKSQTSQRLDIDALRKAYPKVAKEFSKDSTSRPFKSFQFDATEE